MWLQRLLLLGVVLVVSTSLVAMVSAGSSHESADIEENEFAEFEEFDDEDGDSDEFIMEKPKDKKSEPKQVRMAPEAMEAEPDSIEEDDATVEDDDEDEFEHFNDEEEFEGFDVKDRPVKGKGQDKSPELKITKVPLHLRTNWDSFYMEMLMLAGLGVYFLNFLAGKAKNTKLAHAWLSSHKELLENNFSIVGDDGQSPDPTSGVLMKESESVFSLWCSGRACCEGMLVTLKLLKRQDLVSSIARLFKPVSDQIIVKVTLDQTEMDTFVFCLANKKICGKLQKEMQDLSWYCPDKRGVDKFQLPPTFQILAELPEIATAVLDNKMVTALNKYDGLVDYIHVSDQYSGPKQQADESQPSKMPDTQKTLIFCFNAPGQGRCTPKDMESMKPLMQMVLHFVNRIHNIKLSREGKAKADKNRQRMQESFLKSAHAQRTEVAQQRKDERRRAEKDRIMNEEDPEKQRRLEEKNLKKESKKKQPRVKMMKVKM